MTQPPIRAIRADDLYAFQLITDCRISPDGRHVVYPVQRVDRKTEERYSNLWLAPSDGGSPFQFTSGEQADSAPRWSPDGKRIAFLSSRGAGQPPQVYLIPADGGEARRLTDLRGEIGAFEWSPDGARLVLQYRKQDEEEIEREKDEQKKKLGVIVRHYSRVFFKADGHGFLPKDRWHLWLVDARTGAACPLTSDPVFDDLSPAWSPDGNWVAYVSNHSPDPDLALDADDLFMIPTSGGQPRRVETPEGPKALPSFSPDGRWLAYVGRSGIKDAWRNKRLYVVPVDGSQPARDVSGNTDMNVDATVLADLGSRTLMPPAWSKDGQRLYFQAEHHGDLLLLSVGADGQGLQMVIGGPGAVGAYSLDMEQRRLAFVRSGPREPGQVCVRDMGSGGLSGLTTVNDELLSGIDLGRVEEVWFKGSSGNDLQGWIVFPLGFDATRRYPSILEIHGGPQAEYGNLMMHEFHFLAAQGYIVYYCNPRGGTGYGEEHTRAIAEARWGTVDYQDLMAWSDLLAQRPYVDLDRRGVAGGSYGGYMTNWIIGHTNRFKAAVTMRCVSNLISLWGSSDMNWTFQDEFGGSPPYADFARYWQQSPIAYMGSARTPTLVIHNLNDLRCPVEQGEQVFVALKTQGVDTELVLFPDEPHGLSRTGRTDRRIERLNHILRWFDRYLK